MRENWASPKLWATHKVAFREVHASRAQATILILAAGFTAGFECAIVCAYNSCTQSGTKLQKKAGPKKEVLEPSQT